MVALLLTVALAAGSAEARVIHSERSLYQNILITQQGDQRCMKFSLRELTRRQTCIDLDDPQRMVFTYTRMMFAGLLVQPTPAEILVVGLGGGTLPTALAELFPESTLDIETFLSGYDDMLANFGFESWHLFEKRTIRGPNWKIAYDGYMDLYHLPVLHRETFGADRSNKALYFPWGPHQRVISPNRYGPLENLPQDKWPTEMMMVGVWTIFPHISIASFDGGGRSVMLSQLFPGSTPGESYTTQYYLMENDGR